MRLLVVTPLADRLHVGFDIESTFRKWSDVVPDGGSTHSPLRLAELTEGMLGEEPLTQDLEGPTTDAGDLMAMAPRRAHVQSAAGDTTRPTGRERSSRHDSFVRVT